MALTQEDKQQLFATYGVSQGVNDTGSATAQVALFTSRIAYLTDHLKQNPKDRAARLGLVKLVGKRKRQLKYLHNTRITQYRDLIHKLGIRG
jgi:small subunit ribosomal protein S15